MKTKFDIRTIRVKGTGVPNEAVTGAAGILPGHLVARTNAAVETVVVHASAGGVCRPLFAVEDDIQGNGIDDAYANGANALLVYAQPGDEILGVLASGQNVAKEAALTSNGNGQLKAANGTTDHVIGYARNAVDASLAAARVVVEIR